MKTLKMGNAIIPLMFFVMLFTVIGCSKGSGGPGGGGGISPNPVAPKFNSLTVSPSSTIQLNGTAPANAVVNFDVTGSPAPTVSVNGSSVSGSRYTIPATTIESGDIIFSARNSVGSTSETLHLNVVVDPTLAKLTGTTAQGKSWKMTSSLFNGSEDITPCERTFVYTWYANCKSKIDYGTDPACGAGGVFNGGVFTFDPATMTIVDGMPEVVTPCTVTFFPNGTMKFYCVKNGNQYLRTFTPL